MPSTMEEWAKTLDIISSVEPDAGPEPLYPKHEEIEIYADPADFTDSQIEQLEEMGVYAQLESHPPHFYAFT